MYNKVKCLIKSLQIIKFMIKINNKIIILNNLKLNKVKSIMIKNLNQIRNSNSNRNRINNSKNKKTYHKNKIFLKTKFNNLNSKNKSKVGINKNKLKMSYKVITNLIIRNSLYLIINHNKLMKLYHNNSNNFSNSNISNNNLKLKPISKYF